MEADAGSSKVRDPFAPVTSLYGRMIKLDGCRFSLTLKTTFNIDPKILILVCGGVFGKVERDGEELDCIPFVNGASTSLAGKALLTAEPMIFDIRIEAHS